MNKFLKIMALFLVLTMFTACGSVEIIIEDNPMADYIASLEEIPEYQDNHLSSSMRMNLNFQRKIIQRNPMSISVNWIHMEDVGW